MSTRLLRRGRFGWSSVDMDAAIGHEVEVRDWYTTLRGVLEAWGVDGGDWIALRTQERLIPRFTLHLTREIEVLA